MLLYWHVWCLWIVVLSLHVDTVSEQRLLLNVEKRGAHGTVVLRSVSFDTSYRGRYCGQGLLLQFVGERREARSEMRGTSDYKEYLVASIAIVCWDNLLE